MKKIILIIVSLLFLNQHANANQSQEYHCVIDYTQSIMSEQANYIRDASYETHYDFNELGIRVASDNEPLYLKRFFELNEPLVRDYSLIINETTLTLKSNDKTLISADLNNIDKNGQITTRIESYTSSYLMVAFYFYNPETMKDKMIWSVYFDDREIIDKFVARNWGGDGYFLKCQNEIEKTTFKEYQQYWISLYEAISKKKAEYTEEY